MADGGGRGDGPRGRPGEARWRPDAPAEEKLRRVAAQVPGALYTYRHRPDGTSCFPYASEGIRDVYGVDPASVREDASHVWSMLHPDDAAAVADAVGASARDLSPWRQEFRVVLPGRGVRWLRGDATPQREPDGGTLWHGYLVDVTDQLAQARALEELHRRFELATDGLGIGIWEFDLATDTLRWDARMHRIAGTEPGSFDVSPALFLDTVHPEDVAEIQSTFAAALERGEPAEGRYRFRHGDGTWRIAHVRALVAQDPETGSPRLIGTSEDVTERVRAERAAARSEEMLALALAASGDGVWDWRLAERRVHADARWFALLRREPTPDLTVPQDAFADFLPAGDDTEIQPILERTFAAGGPPFAAEHRMIRGDGTVVWVENRAAVIERDDEGNATRLIGSIRDVTARREAERERLEALERVRAFFALSLELLVIGDDDGVVLDLSPAWQTTLGWTIDELKARAFESVIHPDDLEPTFVYARALKHTPQSDPLTIRCRHADGTWRLLECRARHHGGFLYAAARDVTNEREREAALRAAKEAADQANAAKSTFLANMSHEIRTPMNGVVGASELLARQALTPDQRELVSMIGASAHALLAIINDILDFSRVEAGRVTVETVPFDLGEVIDSALAPFLPRARTGATALEARIDPACPRWRRGDPARLRQVLVNLVGNGMKFTASGRVTVEAGGDAETLELRVRDTGPGIPPDRIDHLFAPFVQADPSTSRRYGGTGLGLSICRGILEAMGGTIRAHSVPGEGSEFVVRAPLPATAAPTPAPADPPGASLRPDGTPLRILLAEDNAVNQRVAVRMLERLGARVDVVTNGAAAVEAARAGGFDLVLMDVQMPRMDGYEATRRIRAEAARRGAPRTPIVALTANAMAADREHALAAGMDDHVGKPLRLGELERLLGVIARRG